MLSLKPRMMLIKVKTNETALRLTSTDQLVVVSIPWLLVSAWLLFLVLSWTRINKYGDLCYAFCRRGFRIGEEAETWTLIEFGSNYLLFLCGQAFANVHIALIYCPSVEKQVLFMVLITIWMLPLYTVIVFSGYIFSQFARTLLENFKQLRVDIGEKSKQVPLNSGPVLPGLHFLKNLCFAVKFSAPPSKSGSHVCVCALAC